jgi:hypothetical protein
MHKILALLKIFSTLDERYFKNMVGFGHIGVSGGFDWGFGFGLVCIVQMPLTLNLSQR